MLNGYMVEYTFIPSVDRHAHACSKRLTKTYFKEKIWNKIIFRNLSQNSFFCFQKLSHLKHISFHFFFSLFDFFEKKISVSAGTHPYINCRDKYYFLYNMHIFFTSLHFASFHCMFFCVVFKEEEQTNKLK